MSNIKTIDIMLIDELFEPVGKPGYVLNFNDNSFSMFFNSELSLNIDDPKWSVNGSSKGKRLRYFLQVVDDKTAIKTLDALWNYRKAIMYRDKKSEYIEDAELRFLSLIKRLGGESNTESSSKEKTSIINSEIANSLSKSIIGITQSEPRARGFEFEKFLKSMFDAYGLKAKSSFRNTGEQIDGSFELGNETYLVEAKWQNHPIGVADLHSFQGKINTKAAWTRGLFISYSGFSNEGLTALGSGIKIICMDGLDLHDMLSSAYSLEEVLSQKVRKAAETGKAFVRVNELFNR